jgi:hypothetical protein
MGILNDFSRRKAQEMSDDDRWQILTIAVQNGLRGMGGACGETAIAINKVLFGGRGTYVASVNEYLFNQGRIVGHIMLKIGNEYWDTEQTFDVDDEENMSNFESWGMLDEHDPDWEIPDEKSAYGVKIIDVTEDQIREMLGNEKCFANPYDILLAAVEEWYK